MQVNEFAEARWNRYPLGKCILHTKKRFGVIPIPKTASTTLRKFASPGSWALLKEQSPSDVVLYAAVRHPVDRFLSSIPETILRATPDPRQYSGDVLVSESIYSSICGLDATTGESLVSTFSEVLLKKGLFDPHHFPTAWFLPESLVDEEYSVFTFPLRHLSQALRELGHQWGLNPSLRVPQLNRRSAGGTKSTHPVSGFIREGVAAVRAFFRPEDARMYGEGHPLNVNAKISSRPTSYSVGRATQQIYQSLHTDAGARFHAEKFISEHIPEDFEIWSRLNSQLHENSIFVPLSSIYRI